VKPPRILKNQDTLYWLALTGLLLVFFLWSINHLGGFACDDDEGMFLMTGKMVQLGYPLYTEVWFNYFPAFFVSLATAFKLFGCSVAVGRSVVVLFATTGLLGVALIAQELTGRLGALSALILLALAPHFLKLSRTAMADVPAIALATISIAFALYYVRTGRRRWLILAGVAFSVSLLVKLITAFAIVPLLLSVLLRRNKMHSWIEMAEDWGILALAVAIPILLCLVIFDGRALLDQVVGTYLRSKEVYPLDIAYNVDEMLTYLSGQYGLLALSLYGIVSSLSMGRRKGVLIITGWLCFTVISLLINSPLQPHHLILLLFPLATLSGTAAGEFVSSLSYLTARPLPFDPALRPAQGGAQGRPQRALLLLGLIALGIYILELPEMIVADQELLRQDDEAELGREAVQFVKTMTDPEDFVITDEPMIAFRANRKVPPSLSNTSKMRIRTGHLTDGELIALTKEYEPQAVIFWEHRLHQLPAYVHWVKYHYLLAKQFDDTRQIYIPSDSRVVIQHGQRANLGNQVELLGYSLDDTIIEPGGTIYLTLFWQARREMDISYTVFVHLLDRENQMWGQVDRLPVEGEFLTKHWYPGETVVDEYEIAVNPETPSGVYFLEIGMYDLLYTKERLPIVGEDGERLGDRILLKTPLVVGGERVFEVPKEIQHSMIVNLDDKVTLLGYDLTETEDFGETSSSSVETLSRAVKPGGTLHLTLYWRTRKRMDTSYKVFTHLLDSEGRIWGQRDSVPCDGNYPTTGWLPGEVIVDEYEIPVQSDAPAGEYRIGIGMYDLETMARLPAFNGEGRRLAGDLVLLEPTIVVEFRPLLNLVKSYPSHFEKSHKVVPLC